MKVQVCQLNFTIGDVDGNCRKVTDGIVRARKNGADIVLFSELALVGYAPEDFLLDPAMIDAAERKLREIAPLTKGLFVAVGTPRRNFNRKEKPLFNSAAIFIDGELVGFNDKILLPTYDVFDERRYFEPGEEQKVYEFLGRRIGVTICEDAWQHAGGVGYSDYARDPIEELREKVDLLLNLTASPYFYRRSDARAATFQSAARTLKCPIVLCNQVGANDQIVFDGHSLFVNEKGELIQMAKGFREDDLLVDLSIHACPCKTASDGMDDLYSALVLGVRDYFHKQGFSRAIVGLSGGIDSALTACIGKDALGAENLKAFYMPSRFSSTHSRRDAMQLAKNLGIAIEEISIDALFQQYLDLMEPHFEGKEEDITEENFQSRIRGNILMGLSNKLGSLVLATGDKSEMAMGYTTLYGDMVGAIGVLQDVTKTNVYRLARHLNQSQEIIPESILTKPPSPELRAGQTAFDRLPPFEILDPILEEYLEERLSPQEIAAQQGQPLDVVLEIVRRIHAAEYKRRQAPIGIRVTQKAFSKGRRIPIVQKWVH